MYDASSASWYALLIRIRFYCLSSMTCSPKIKIPLRNKTEEQYDGIVAKCRGIYVNKLKDYGPSWRVLRPSSLTDQLFIKANRIKTIEQGKTKKVEEEADVEFMGLVNYCLIALIQLDAEKHTEFSFDLAVKLFDQKAALAKEVMQRKNHDYGEAWRSMRISSFTDLILMKLLRIKQIEDNGGGTLVSEGIDSHYIDIINYAVFALIKIEENEATLNT